MFKKKGKNHLIRALICAVAVLTAGSAVFAADIPADAAGSAHSEAITALVEADVITGSTDGLFHPADNLTRAQACVIIVKAINPPEAEVSGTPTQRVPASGFSDMAGYGWADGYVGYAVRNNIVNGYPDGTFKPGNNVTSNEMLAMVLRAAGFKDEEIGSNWPNDFIAKASAEGITQGLAAELSEFASKETAARMTYNKFDALRARGAAADEAAASDGSAGSGTNGTAGNAGSAFWAGEGLTFATGKFNDNMTRYAGTAISPNAAVYTYGLKADYKSGMQLPAEQGAYRADTVNKYKVADTPCFYIKTGDEITLMILPTDAGFSGRIYCVINSTSNTTNGKGEKVNNIYTLAAAQQVAWLTKDSEMTLPVSQDYLNGQVYELTSANGTISAVATASGGHEDFAELTGGAWEKVGDFSDGVITLDASGAKFATEDNTVVYVLEADGKSYKVGKKSDIRANVEIRAFSISDEGEIASYVTVKKN